MTLPTTRDKQACIERFGMRGMDIPTLQTMVQEHKPHAMASYASRVIVQAAREQIFVNQATGRE